MHRRLAISALLSGALAAAGFRPARAAPVPRPPARPLADRFFVTSDGARLHYTDQGAGHTIVLVPGWTMPAWIFERQIADFSRFYRVVGFDPRGQGESAIPPSGYDAPRRGRDIGELLDHLGSGRVVLLGWSLGVLDVLAYVHQEGDSRLASLVLVDNSIGEEPPPTPAPPPAHPAPRLTHEERMRRFVPGMFARPQPRAWIERLTEACLRTPEWAARALLAYDQPRSYWREAVYSTSRPVLYVVRPRWAGQAANLAAHHPDAETLVMQNVGHALFVDDPAGFDATLGSFLRRRVWPQ